MMQNTAVLGLRYFAVDLFGGVLFFPVWWYTRGLAMILRWLGRRARGANVRLGVGVWIRNLFVPMYGETSFGGRVISFFARLVMIAVRGVAWIIWMIVVFALFVFYFLVLPAGVIGLIIHLAL